MKENRGYLFLLTGLLLGVLVGIGLDRVVRPAPVVHNAPAALLPQYKDEYRVLIASAYLADGDLLRARERLKLLRDADIYTALAEQAQRSLSTGRDPEEARALGELAVAIGKDSRLGNTPMTTNAPLPGTPTQELVLDGPAASPNSTDELGAGSGSTPGSSGLAGASATETMMPESLFVLEDRQWVCSPGSENPLIVVQVEDASGQPVPGQEIVVTWDGGEERFYTGLKPEFGQGYADFEMAPGIVYTLRLEAGGQNITGLAAQDCKNISGNPYWGKWQLKFVQP